MRHAYLLKKVRKRTTRRKIDGKLMSPDSRNRDKYALRKGQRNSQGMRDCV